MPSEPASTVTASVIDSTGSSGDSGSDRILLEERVARLTVRQNQCLRLVAQGYTSKEIARELALSPSTVDNHILAAVQLLAVSTRGEAARVLVRARETVPDFAGQDLPRQQQTLGIPSQSATMAMSDGDPQRDLGRTIRHLFSLPPIGGRTNELGWEQRSLHIVQIAVITLLAVVALSLIIAGAMDAFS